MQCLMVAQKQLEIIHGKGSVKMKENYQNKDNKCECRKCEKREKCIHANAIRRLSKNIGGLGLCPKLK